MVARQGTVTGQRTGVEEPAARGVVFPVVDGRRSTTATGAAVFADAARVLDPALADAIEAERNWRTSYLHHIRRLVEARVTRPAAADTDAGLASAHRRFEFVRDGEARTLDEALDAPGPHVPRTATIEGRGARSDRGLAVPYRGELLDGQALDRQLERWVNAGTVEPSFADAVRAVAANPDWLDLSGQTVVLLGAGAEMGPLESLSRWGADVVAVDIPSPSLWERIIATARAGSGRLSVPVTGELPADADDARLAAAAGVDLVTDTPEVAAWLDQLDGPLVLGNHVYADGGDNVRVAMAVDAIIARLGRRRDGGLAVAALATPTDVYAVPEEVVRMANRRLAQAGMVQRTARRVTGGRLYAPNYDDLVATPDGVRFGVVDCVVAQQGPNYLLAKHLQRWRAQQARADGHVSSINVAPPTRTRSVLKNRVLAAAYAAADRFGVEAFAPDTSRTLMAALLVHDLRNPVTAAHPDTALAHPIELLSQGANHGGLWRIPFSPRSVLGLAAVRGLVTRRG